MEMNQKKSFKDNNEQENQQNHVSETKHHVSFLTRLSFIRKLAFPVISFAGVFFAINAFFPVRICGCGSDYKSLSELLHSDPILIIPLLIGFASIYMLAYGLYIAVRKAH